MTLNSAAAPRGLSLHAMAIELEMNWLATRIEKAIVALESSGPDNQPEVTDPPALPLDSSYGTFVAEHNLSPDQRLILILALSPELAPQVPDKLLQFGDSRVGGVIGSQHHGFLPTIQTALFLLAGDNLERNLEARRLFEPSSGLLNKNIICVGCSAQCEPYTSMVICVKPGLSSYLCTGEFHQMIVDDIPAKRLKSSLTLEELVLPDNLLAELGVIRDWLEHGRKLRSKFKFSRPGFKALFYGPSGTGKALTATLLGQSMNLPVYQLDLGRTISQDFGVTEKNIETVLTQAERQSAILFFDESYITVGKSGSRRFSDSNISQGIATLVKALEDYDGLVILADSVEENTSRVMNFRFSARLYFPHPDRPSRVKLWQMILGDIFQLPETCGLDDLACFSLTGGEIVNVVQYLTLAAIKKGDFNLTQEMIDKAVEREIMDSARGISR